MTLFISFFTIKSINLLSISLRKKYFIKVFEKISGTLEETAEKNYMDEKELYE